MSDVTYPREIKCGKCGKRTMCSSFEDLEFQAVRHMAEEHNFKALYFDDQDSGKLTEIPE